MIEFLDCEREKQAVNFGRLSARPAETREGDGQLSRPASKEFTSGLSLGTSKLGMGVSERDIAAINPVSGRSIYASVYATLSAGNPVSEINAEFAGDTEYLEDINFEPKNLADKNLADKYRAIGSAV